MSGSETLHGLYFLVLLGSAGIPEVPSVMPCPLCGPSARLTFSRQLLWCLCWDYIWPQLQKSQASVPQVLSFESESWPRRGHVRTSLDLMSAPLFAGCRSGPSHRGVACVSALGRKWEGARGGCGPEKEDTSALPGYLIGDLHLGLAGRESRKSHGATTPMFCVVLLRTKGRL